MSKLRSIQAPSAIVMIRPHGFTPNPETAADNTFQSPAEKESVQAVARAAYREVTAAAERMEIEGVRVHLFEDRGERDTPDSVFPNNWFSTHPGGHVALYPMYCSNRRRERRPEIIEMLIEIGRHPNTFAGPGFSLGRLDRNYLDDGFVLLHNYYVSGQLQIVEEGGRYKLAVCP